MSRGRRQHSNRRYYGGSYQIEADYGGPLTGYAKPRPTLDGSIMPRSNTDGAGRGSYNRGKKTVIGDVINHGKKQYWDPSRSYHYHGTLSAGEETLEASLARVLMRTVSESGGLVNAEAFRGAYVNFMTKPGSHNDSRVRGAVFFPPTGRTFRGRVAATTFRGRVAATPRPGRGYP